MEICKRSIPYISQGFSPVFGGDECHTFLAFAHRAVQEGDDAVRSFGHVLCVRRDGAEYAGNMERTRVTIM